MESRAPPHAPLRDVPGRAARAPLASSLSTQKQPRPFAAAQDQGSGHFIPSELASSKTLAHGRGRQPRRGRHGAKVRILLMSTGTQWQAASVRSERVDQRPGRQFCSTSAPSHCETGNALAFLAFFATLSEGSVPTLYFAWTFGEIFGGVKLPSQARRRRKPKALSKGSIGGRGGGGGADY